MAQSRPHTAVLCVPAERTSGLAKAVPGRRCAIVDSQSAIIYLKHHVAA
jgi:hypothetical protein